MYLIIDKILRSPVFLSFSLELHSFIQQTQKQTNIQTNITRNRIHSKRAENEEGNWQNSLSEDYTRFANNEQLNDTPEVRAMPHSNVNKRLSRYPNKEASRSLYTKRFLSRRTSSRHCCPSSTPTSSSPLSTEKISVSILLFGLVPDRERPRGADTG